MISACCWGIISAWRAFPALSIFRRATGWSATGAPDEGHFDATFGLYVTPNLLLMAQSFNTISGASHNPQFPQWAQSKAQLSLVV